MLGEPDIDPRWVREGRGIRQQSAAPFPIPMVTLEIFYTHATIKLMQRIVTNTTFTFFYFWFTKREAWVRVRNDS